MICPKCKKSAKLRTKRTLANGSTCKRERFCPKCKNQIFTIELLQEDYDKTIEELNNKIKKAENKAYQRESDCEDLKSAIKTFVSFAK